MRHEDGPLLGGVRVLDFSQALAGPYATMLLGDLGAEIIKIEKRGRGDDTRHWGPPFVGEESAYFLSINRNKRSVAIDLKSEGGRKVALDLAANSDVVFENFRPGTAARLGIGPDDLSRLNPGLVYCSISGFGQDRPPRTGYDQIVQGTAGLMSITGLEDGPPIKVGVPISDIVAGMFAAHAVLAALYQRVRTGKGRHVDVALQDAVVALLTFQAGRYFVTGSPPGREGNHHPTIAPYGTFETSDGYINVCVGNDDQWRRFCNAVEHPTLEPDSRFVTNADRLAHRGDLHEAIEPLLNRRSTAEWLERFEEAGVPAGAIRSLDEVFEDEDVVGREMRVEMDHAGIGRMWVTGAPWKVDGASADLRLAPPLLGQHTQEVLAEVAGYDEKLVRRLEADGSIECNDRSSRPNSEQQRRARV